MHETHLQFQRARFRARLPLDCSYTAGHVWIARRSPGLWRVGYTKYALRLLGELVELDFEVGAGDPLERGRAIGWIEGFKAVSDIIAPLDGHFRGANPALADTMALLQRDPHSRGWLYEVEGEAPPDLMNAEGYAQMLTEQIDAMTRGCS